MKIHLKTYEKIIIVIAIIVSFVVISVFLNVDKGYEFYGTNCKIGLNGDDFYYMTTQNGWYCPKDGKSCDEWMNIFKGQGYENPKLYCKLI